MTTITNILIRLAETAIIQAADERIYTLIENGKQQDYFSTAADVSEFLSRLCGDLLRVA